MSGELGLPRPIPQGDDRPMNKIEAVQLALKELGEVTDENLVAFVQIDMA
jgi:hypothetical protein